MNIRHTYKTHRGVTFHRKLKSVVRIFPVVALGLILLHNFFIQPDSYWEITNTEAAFAFFGESDFNPRVPVYNVLEYIHAINTGQDSAFGDNEGLFFHWDDWVDLSSGDSLLDEYRDLYPHGATDDALREYASVNPYRMELYATKILRSAAYTYAIQDIPDRVVLMSDKGLIELQVGQRRRLGDVSRSLSVPSKAKLVKQMVNADKELANPLIFKPVNRQNDRLAILHPYKKYPKTIKIENDQFVFNPEVEIMKLRAKLAGPASLTPFEREMLASLEYANSIVDSSDKYFKYPWIYSDLVRGQAHHLESSFFRRFVSTRERQSVLHRMTRAWFEFAQANGIVSWVNYGSLLGWVYNGLNMPWDTDVDIQIPIKQLAVLGAEHNRTLVIENPRYGNGKYYLDISPTYIRQGNGRNFIDGRFIEVNTGLYIDISALSRTNYKPPSNLFDGLSEEEASLVIPVNCKNFNWQLIEEILPIKYATFEGGLAYIPNIVSRILDRKYGRESYTTKEKFHAHNYQSDLNMWVPDRICSKPPSMKTEDRFTDPHEKNKLTFEGACRSHELQDEFDIMYECSQRHVLLEDDQDVPVSYDISEKRSLPFFRKDAWDYYNDILEGNVDHEKWYVRESYLDVGKDEIDR